MPQRMNQGLEPYHGNHDTVHAYSIHPTIRDKPEWKGVYASDWQPQSGQLELLRSHVSNGGAFIAAQMTSTHRSSSVFKTADLAVADIDHGLTIDEFKSHPLAAHCAWAYTTTSHGKSGDRFRAIFRLPESITDPQLYKSVLNKLIRELGSDKSCSDVCRIFYGNSKAEHFIWSPDAQLPASFIDEAERETRRRLAQEAVRVNDYDDVTLEQAIFVLEQVIEPTADGERDRFIDVTVAAKAGGDALLTAWMDWASRSHHGKGSKSHQAREKFFRSFKGGAVPTLFRMANETDPEWRSQLPDELRSTGDRPLNVYGSAVGYDHEDFLMGEPWDEPSPPTSGTATKSVFDALPTTNEHPLPSEQEPDWDYDPEDFQDLSGLDEQVQRGPGRPRNQRNQPNATNDGLDLEEMYRRLKSCYPGLRKNIMSQTLEYGPKHQPIEIDDVSHAYLRISLGADRVYPKTTTYDAAHYIGNEEAYHPVCNYLKNCVRDKKPVDYLDRFASEILGIKDDPMLNPYMPDGVTLFADEVMKRFLIGAVARAFEPGCTHDWMPIFVGAQNLGKTTFFQYLTPPCPSDPGHYPWVSTLQQGIGYIKDRPHVLHGGWLMIMDECERYFNRKDTEVLKNLVSCPVDRSARKYENERNFKRGFVLAGATNTAEFLSDPTGNRRFMPLVIEGKVPSKEDPSIKIIDLDRLKEDRDSIWAAAYQAYMDCPKHTFSSFELSHVSETVESFTKDSPLDVRIRQAMDLGYSGRYPETGPVGQKYWLMADLFKQLDVPLAQERSMLIPISDALKRMGLINTRHRLNGRVVRLWLHKNPRSEHMINNNSIARTYQDSMSKQW